MVDLKHQDLRGEGATVNGDKHQIWETNRGGKKEGRKFREGDGEG